jgi:DNA-binding LytR/AlgR family response regulator
MIRTLIIEDELPAAQRLQKLITETTPDVHIESILDSVETSVSWLQKHSPPELIFLDIQLADGLSFEIFKKIKVDSFIIFTTAYDEYAIKAFELNSIDYLLKPVNKEHLARALEKFRIMQGRLQFDVKELLDVIEKRKSAYKSRFVINISNKIRTIETEDIAYFYSSEKSAFLSSKEGKTYPLDFSLDKIENMVDPDVFYRINRQYLISYEAISNILVLTKSRIKLELRPAPEEEVFVSNARAPEFRRWLDR